MSGRRFVVITCLVYLGSVAALTGLVLTLEALQSSGVVR